MTGRKRAPHDSRGACRVAIGVKCARRVALDGTGVVRVGRARRDALPALPTRPSVASTRRRTGGAGDAAWKALQAVELFELYFFFYVDCQVNGLEML